MNVTTPKRTGKILECKFCHKEVWYDFASGRCYEPCSKILHSERCPRSRAHASRESFENHEARRHER